MKLHEIADNPGARKHRVRIGRGIGSGCGKTGGRGGKGQTARSGVRIKGFEGGQMPLHRRLPKRGFNNIFRIKLNEVNLGNVQTAIDAGLLDAKGAVDSAALVKAGVLRREKAGVRLLGGGEIKSKVEFVVYGASKSAIAAVEKAGGSVKILAPVKDASEPKKEKKSKAKKAEAKKAEAKKAEAKKAETKPETKAEGGDKPKAEQADAKGAE